MAPEDEAVAAAVRAEVNAAMEHFPLYAEEGAMVADRL
jgi:hypothetical protein